MVDYSKEIEEVKEHYADLLIMQYHSKYKARETVKLGAEIYMGDGVIFELQDILDIDKAEGKQLDIIGKILDCPRQIPGLNNDIEYFSFQKENALGFSTINKLSKGFFKDLTYDYNAGSFYALSDSDYRLLLKFKAIANRVKASWSEIDSIFYEVFGNGIKIRNNKNLSITYVINSDMVSLGLEAVIKLGYLEPPLGISSNIIYTEVHTFTINTTPSTAKITLTADGYEQKGNSITVNKGVIVDYKIEAEGYKTITGSHLIEDDDETLDIEMEYILFTFTLNVEPEIANPIIKLTATGYQQVENSISVPKNTIINYTVTANSKYESVTGNYIMDSEDFTKNIYLQRKIKETYYAYYNSSEISTSNLKNILFVKNTPEINIDTTLYILYNSWGNLLTTPSGGGYITELSNDGKAITKRSYGGDDYVIEPPFIRQSQYDVIYY